MFHLFVIFLASFFNRKAMLLLFFARVIFNFAVNDAALKRCAAHLVAPMVRLDLSFYPPAAVRVHQEQGDWSHTESHIGKQGHG